MLFSSAMEEASGKHYEVRFSTTQRWAVASIVLLVLTVVYLACEAAVFVLSALAPEASGIMWGGELVSGEVLRPLRLAVVMTLCCALEVCQVMVRSRLLWERGEKDELLVVARRHRNVGLALVALGAALMAAALALGLAGAFVLPAVLGIVCGVVIALAATFAGPPGALWRWAGFSRRGPVRERGHAKISLNQLTTEGDACTSSIWPGASPRASRP